MRRAALLCLLIVSACRKQEATVNEAEKPHVAPQPSSSIVPQPPRAPGIDAKVKATTGTHDMRTALVWSTEGSPVVHLEMSTHARTCKDLEGDHTRIASGEEIFEAVLAPPLRPGGEWNIATVFHSTTKNTVSPAIGSYGKASVASADPAKPMKVTFNSPMTGDSIVSGTVEASPCGFQKRPDPAPAKSEQKGLTLEIDGQKVPVMGARYDAKREQIVLSSGGLACGADSFEEPVDLRIEPDEMALFGFSVNGDELRLDDPPKYTLGKPDKGAVDATFNIDATIGGHRTKVTGKGRLLVCE